MKTNLVHTVTHVENSLDSGVEVSSYSKNKGKKRVLDGVLL